MAIHRSVGRRDLILVALGALCMHFFSLMLSRSAEPQLLLPPIDDSNSQNHLNVPPPYIKQEQPRPPPQAQLAPLPPPKKEESPPQKADSSSSGSGTATTPVSISFAHELPETSIVQHAPGWTIFKNLYMADGTLFVVSPHPASYFPAIRMITSTGLEADNTPDNEQQREPTSKNLAFLSMEQAHERWGGNVASGVPNRVLSIEGNTLLFNDPKQFLRHYYHFVAELMLGAWSFWTGSLSTAKVAKVSAVTTPFTSTTFDPSLEPPPIHRIIFAHSNADGWRDNPGFNAYFLRAVFPSIVVEHEEDWKDRIVVTAPPKSQFTFENPDPNPEETAANEKKVQRAWHFPLVLLADRSAAFRGAACGSRTQRTASEAFEAMNSTGKLQDGWWEPLRKSMLRFAGATENVLEERGQVVLDANSDAAELPMPEKVVITYISRQSTQRKLVPEDHEVLVQSLNELVERKGWELIVVQAEKLTKDEQVRIIGRTTILLGVHGNGLTHLVLMPPTRVSTVIEMFIPNGFAHDYEWTTRALGMKHFAVWNDTHHTYPNEPRVDYPEGFQGPAIPVHGPTVAKLIEDRVEGRL